MDEFMKGFYKEYQEVLAMTEEQVMEEYGDCKSYVLSEYEKEIDEYEKREEDNEESSCSCYHLDPAFSSWEQVNRMFV